MTRFILLTVVAALPSTVFAQQQARALFERWDTNKDGQLASSELPESARRNFKKVDLDSDGVISLQEHLTYLRNRQRQSTTASTNVKVLRDLPYIENGHERQKLDIYIPKADGDPRPLVVWIHGGGWRQGSKDRCRAVPLLQKGFVVASINYRLSGHAVFPAQIHDCKAAIRWLRSHAVAFGVDPDRIGVWGSSAGGHLVALLGTSGDVEDLEGSIGVTGVSSRVQAVCDWYGPTDLLLMNKQAGDLGTLDHDAPDSPESKLLGGTLQTVPDKAKRASPLTYTTSDDPAFLILHGDKDRLVPWKQSELLESSLKEAGCDVQFSVVPGAGHGFPDKKITDRSFEFFERVLGQKRD